MQTRRQKNQCKESDSLAEIHPLPRTTERAYLPTRHNYAARLTTIVSVQVGLNAGRCVFNRQRAGRMGCARFKNTRGAQLSLKRSPTRLPTNYPPRLALGTNGAPLVRAEAFELGRA